jgi:hypothetical protein
MRKSQLQEKPYSQAEAGNEVTKVHSAPMGVARSARRHSIATESA